MSLDSLTSWSNGAGDGNCVVVPGRALTGNATARVAASQQQHHHHRPQLLWPGSHCRDAEPSLERDDFARVERSDFLRVTGGTRNVSTAIV